MEGGRCMGGRAAEELVFNHFSTGASDDLRQATRLAREMVCHYGMSDKIGPVSYDEQDGDVFLGRDFVSRKNYSEKVAEQIDEEVRGLLTRLYGEARQLLADNRPALDRIADALLERETLETADLEALLAGQPLPPLPAPLAAEPAPAPAEAPEARKGEAAAPGGLPEPEPLPG